MRKRTSFDIAYDALAHIDCGPINEVAISELKHALNGHNSLLASMAADIAAKNDLNELIPDMIAAFERFMIDGARTDKQCSAKTSIINALNKLEFTGDKVFLTGASCVQMEPVYGGRVDTAVHVRSGCAFALARIEHPDAHYILTELLVDPEHVVRASAAKALGYLAHPESELLLRFKALTGDSEPEVMRECFEGLMAMAPERSLSFVARYARAGDVVSQYAALAISNSRLPQAYDILRECWDDFPSPTARRMLILPIALVRSNESFNFLLDIVRTADVNTAAEAISALNIYTSEESTAQLSKVVISRKIPELIKIFNSEFGL